MSIICTKKYALEITGSVNPCFGVIPPWPPFAYSADALAWYNANSGIGPVSSLSYIILSFQNCYIALGGFILVGPLVGWYNFQLGFASTGRQCNYVKSDGFIDCPIGPYTLQSDNTGFSPPGIVHVTLTP